MPNGQTKSRSMLLALIAVIVFFSGFIGVYLVNAAWESQIPETIIVSDATAVPLNQKMGDVKFTSTLKNYTSAYSYDSFYNGTYNTTELTPVYSGNSTWTFSAGTLKPHPTGDLDPTGASTRMMLMFRLPNIDTYLINEVFCRVNFTSTVGFAIERIEIGGFAPDVALPIRTNPEHYYSKRIFESIAGTDSSLDDYTFDVNVNLADAIDIYQNLNDGKDEGYIFFDFEQLGNSGWDPLAMEITFHINGTFLDQTNKVNAVAYSLGGAAFLCTITGIFMTDSVDWDDIKKSLGWK